MSYAEHTCYNCQRILPANLMGRYTYKKKTSTTARQSREARNALEAFAPKMEYTHHFSNSTVWMCKPCLKRRIDSDRGAAIIGLIILGVLGFVAYLVIQSGTRPQSVSQAATENQPDETNAGAERLARIQGRQLPIETVQPQAQDAASVQTDTQAQAFVDSYAHNSADVTEGGVSTSQ